MDPNTAPVPLRERLGPDGTYGLVQLLETVRADWTGEVLSLSTERFERTLAQELATLRATLREEMARGDAELRVEMTRGDAALREDLAREGAALRVEIATARTELKVEMQEGFGALRQQMASDRFELLKWSFLFWVGQVITVVGLVGVMLRAFSPPG